MCTECILQYLEEDSYWQSVLCPGIRHVQLVLHMFNHVFLMIISHFEDDL